MSSFKGTLFGVGFSGGGDGTIGLDDILKMLDAFGGNPPCDDPCPG